MAHSSHSEQRVPSALVNRSRENWHWFTQGIIWHCVGAAVVLLVLLLVYLAH